MFVFFLSILIIRQTVKILPLSYQALLFVFHSLVIGSLFRFLSFFLLRFDWMDYPIFKGSIALYSNMRSRKKFASLSILISSSLCFLSLALCLSVLFHYSHLNLIHSSFSQFKFQSINVEYYSISNNQQARWNVEAIEQTCSF
jgi:hypothetical protein